MSNETVTKYVPQPQAQLNGLLLAQNFLMAFVNPTMVVIGIIGNFIIIALFPLKKVHANESAKLYCMVIAVGDIGTLLLKHLREFITIGLFFISSGKFYIDLFYPILCKILNCSFMVFLVVSMYTVMAFSIERSIAVFWPLKYRAYMTRKATIILLALCVCPPLIILQPLCLSTMDILKTRPGQLPNCGPDPKNPLYAFTGLAIVVVLMILHAPITLFLVIALVRKLLKNNARRSRLGINAPSQSSIQKQALILLLLVAIINLLFFVPIASLYGSATFFRVVAPTSYIRQLIDYLVRILYQLTSISHSANFFVYFAIIPSFRKSVCDLCCCGFNNVAKDQTTSSTAIKSDHHLVK